MGVCQCCDKKPKSYSPEIVTGQQDASTGQVDLKNNNQQSNPLDQNNESIKVKPVEHVVQVVQHKHIELQQQGKLKQQSENVNPIQNNSVKPIEQVEQVGNIQIIQPDHIESQQQVNIKKQSEKVEPIKNNSNQLLLHQDNANQNIRLMLLGLLGVGKTRLFNRLHEKQIIDEEIDQFQSCKLVWQERSYYVIDTPPFEIDGSIDQREQTISYFQKYFDKKQEGIMFGIVVNFERTDLMKRKVSDVYKYIRKFAERIYIIIVNFDLSQNKIEDKKHLTENFGVYHAKDIIFIENQFPKEQLTEKLCQIVYPKLLEPLDLTDTIFEKIDSESSENRRLKNTLNNLIRQKP